MGSFSWLRADVTTSKANIACGDAFACLIPKEFGGGYIVDKYRDYGDLYDEDKNVEYDMYELLAFWNKDIVGERLKYDGDFPNLKAKDKYTDYNRNRGIDIACYDIDIDTVKYPLKLVSVKYAKTHTYEDCKNKSFGDPNQGCYGMTWKKYIEGRFYTSNPRVCPGIYKLLQDRLSYIENDNKKYEEIDLIKEFLTNCKLVDEELDDLVTKAKDIQDEVKMLAITTKWKPEVYGKQLENLNKMLSEANKKVEEKENELNELKASLSSNSLEKKDEIERD